MCEGEMIGGETLEVQGEVEPVWIDIPGQAVIDLTGFVLFGKHQCYVQTGNGYEYTWTVEAYPGPKGHYMQIAICASESQAEALLARIAHRLISK